MPSVDRDSKLSVAVGVSILGEGLFFFLSYGWDVIRFGLMGQVPWLHGVLPFGEFWRSEIL